MTPEVSVSISTAPLTDPKPGTFLDTNEADRIEAAMRLYRQRFAEPGAAIMIGDRAADVRAAKASGVRSIGVLRGYGSERELIDAKADELCATPHELFTRLARAQFAAEPAQ